MVQGGPGGEGGSGGVRQDLVELADDQERALLPRLKSLTLFGV